MINIDLFRYRIGIFNLTNCNRTKVNAFKKMQHSDKKVSYFIFILMMLSIIWISSRSLETKVVMATTFGSVDPPLVRRFSLLPYAAVWTSFTGNFYAKHLKISCKYPFINK